MKISFIVYSCGIAILGYSMYLYENDGAENTSFSDNDALFENIQKNPSTFNNLVGSIEAQIDVSLNDSPTNQLKKTNLSSYESYNSIKSNSEEQSLEFDAEHYLVYMEENVGSLQAQDNFDYPEPIIGNSQLIASTEFSDQINQGSIIEDAIANGYLDENTGNKSSNDFPEPTDKNANMKPKEYFYSEIDQNAIVEKAISNGNKLTRRSPDAPSNDNVHLNKNDEFSDEINVSL